MGHEAACPFPASPHGSQAGEQFAPDPLSQARAGREEVASSHLAVQAVVPCQAEEVKRTSPPSRSE